jgi:hypothetical protein
MAIAPATPDSVRNQFESARARYPALVERGPSDFSIVLGNPPAEYRIRLPPTYPKTAPEVTKNQSRVDLFVISNWSPYFNLLSVIDGIAVISMAAPAQHFVLDVRELRSAYDSATSDLSDPAARQALVKNLKSLQGLDQERAKAQRTIQTSEEKGAQALEAASAVAGRLSGLEAERQRCYAEVTRLEAAGPPKPKPEVVREKIRTLENEVAEADRKIQEAIQQYATDDKVGPALSALMEAAAKKKLALLTKEEIIATFT